MAVDDDGSLVSVTEVAEVAPAVVVAPGRFDLCCNFKRRCFMYNNCSSSAAASDLSCVGLYGETNAFCGGLVDVRLEMSVSGVFIIVEVVSSSGRVVLRRHNNNFLKRGGAGYPKLKTSSSCQWRRKKNRERIGIGKWPPLYIFIYLHYTWMDGTY